MRAPILRCESACVGVHLRRPSDRDLARLLAACPDQHLTYEPTGVCLGAEAPAGLSRRTWTTALQQNGAFGRAVTALSGWSMHTHAGLSVIADGPLVVGTNVALSAPLPAGYIDATCRIVATIDEPGRFGFAYGTLPVHPEQGEEAFVVTDGTPVLFEVSAVSRPAHPLARLVPPVANRLQDAAIRRYLSAMERLTSSQ